MKIQESEIVSVENIGTLNGKPVKLMKCKGGFNFAMGTLRGKKTDEALGAGSHRAIVIYNIEKQYPDFQPAMNKSEVLSEKTIVEKHTHFLPEVLQKSGHDIYSIQKGHLVNFHVTRHGSNVSTSKAQFKDQTLVVSPDKMLTKELGKAMASAVTEKAVSCGSNSVVLK